MNVLYVEDNAADADLARRYVERKSPAVRMELVSTLSAARERLRQGAYEVILTDLALPDGDGMELLREVKQQALPVAVVILTGAGDEQIAVAALRGGATDYLPKRDGYYLHLPFVLQHALTKFQSEQARRSHLIRVLYAEHQEADADLTARHVARLAPHIQVDRVAGSREVLELLNQHEGRLPYNVLLLDYRLPGMNALELLKALQEAGASDVPVVIVTGEGDEELAVQALRLGAAHYLPKRATFHHELVAALEMVDARTSLERERRALLAAQERLQASEERFREVVETIQEVFWVKSLARGTIEYVSSRFSVIWGRPVEAVYENHAVWLDSVHPEDRTRVATSFGSFTAPVDITYRIVRPDGGLRWIRDQAFPVLDAATGAATRFVGVAEDVTDRKVLEQQFLQAQRLEAIGTLASGVAHDLNNILAPICMAPAILRGKLSDPGDQEVVALIEAAARRGAGVVRQLLTFSRGMSGPSGPVQLRHLIREVLHMLRETFPRDITVRDHLAGDLGLVHGDATQLHQVLVNLCVNARDAMTRGGVLFVRAENRTVAAPQVGRRVPVPGGDYVVVTVTDTGEGIPPHVLDRIFDPFFTTKEEGKGTGLGLSTVLGIVQSHRGVIDVHSVVGQGTTFEVFLPRLPADTPVGSAAATPRVPRGAGQRVLVVDDEPQILQMTQKLLEGLGYTVYLSQDGREALDLVAQHRDIRLVITDLMMPTMGGVELIEALRHSAPHLPIIVTSGLQRPEQFTRDPRTRGLPFISKPLQPDQLLPVIEQQLAGAPR